MAHLHTPLCDQLGIDYPIFSVGFAASAGVELAAAVSGAGGCGVMGWGGMPQEEVRRRIALVRSMTSRPFGFNIIIAGLHRPDASEERRNVIRASVAAAIDARVPLLVLFWGDPAPFVETAHDNGVKVFVQTGDVEEAVAAAKAGVDGIIAQGVEAGGHVRATESLWKVLPEVVKAVSPVPVVAAGGIGDGAAIARALQLGAQGVSLGTRFVASQEAWVHRAHKERIVTSTAEDTVFSELFDGGWPDAPHRVLRNRVVEEWEAAGKPPSGRRPGEGTTIGTYRMPWGEEGEWHRYEVGMIPPDFEGDPEYAPMWAGTSVDAVNDIKPAAEIVMQLVREAEASMSGGAPHI